jgi:hypothetical protein
MSNSTDAHDPSVGVGRRHLPIATSDGEGCFSYRTSPGVTPPKPPPTRPVQPKPA